MFHQLIALIFMHMLLGSFARQIQEQFRTLGARDLQSFCNTNYDMKEENHYYSWLAQKKSFAQLKCLNAFHFPINFDFWQKMHSSTQSEFKIRKNNYLMPHFWQTHWNHPYVAITQSKLYLDVAQAGHFPMLEASNEPQRIKHEDKPIWLRH